MPAGYVAVDLSLGYAGTVHAYQGMTVDTGHDVTTARTPAHLLYPGATRSKESNTLYVVTRDADDDAAPGEVAQGVIRDPRSVLATILETDRTESSATAHAAESAAEAVSARTAAERLGAVAEVVVSERTTGWLDELTATGELTIAQRRRLAAEDGVAKLAPVLRRLELAGHDPHAALVAALDGRNLDDAQQVSNVLVHRLTQGRSFDPDGAGFADWAPATDDPALAAQLAQIAEAGDARRHQLGHELAAAPPTWARELLGPAPDPGRPEARREWVERAGTIAAHREIAGLTDEPADPVELLGPAPKPGQVEAYAAWRAAWRASGQPDIDRDERQMTTGQLRVRVRAWEREQAWAPRRVTNELAGTHQAITHHRQAAQLTAAAAHAAGDPAERAQLAQRAREATALAETLEADLPRLQQLDDLYTLWRAHTAGTRAAHDRAIAELAARGQALTGTDHQFTAAELLAADRAAREQDDAYREITEHDLTDHPDDIDTTDPHDLQTGDDPVMPRPADREPVGCEPVGCEPVGREEADRAKELVVPRELLDLRELAAEEPAQAGEDIVRAPSPQELEDSTRRAVRALGEITGRNAADAAREAADEQAQQSRVHYWRTRDVDAETAAADRDTAAEWA